MFAVGSSVFQGFTQLAGLGGFVVVMFVLFAAFSSNVLVCVNSQTHIYSVKIRLLYVCLDDTKI